MNMTQGQHMRLSQQQLMYVRLLEMNAPEFDEAVERELVANPALEESEAEQPADKDATPYYLRHIRNGGGEDSSAVELTPPDESESLVDYLNLQLSERNLDEETTAMAEYIVGSLDSGGYLRRTLANVVNDLAFSTGMDVDMPTAERAMKVVQSLDPPGIGARSLQECLMLQLERLPAAEVRDDAITIIRDYFEPFTMRHSNRIISGMRISQSRVEAANRLITSLNPKPGAAFGGVRETAAGIIIPDFIVSEDDETGELYVTVNNSHPELRIGDSYTAVVKALEGRRGKARKGSEHILSSYNDARDFIALMQRRQKALLSVMSAIVRIQKEYFLSGDVYLLKPMMIKDISELTGMDLSAISRATNNKYVEMPWGEVKPLRDLFSNEKGDSETGDTLTNRQIEAEIEAVVGGEDKKHPLSDERIREEMLKRGYDISRRTIAKYRARKGIPVARLRRKM